MQSSTRRHPQGNRGKTERKMNVVRMFLNFPRKMWLEMIRDLLTSLFSIPQHLSHSGDFYVTTRQFVGPAVLTCNNGGALNR